MQTRRRALFSTVRTEGAILPPDLLQRIAEGDGDLKGLTTDDYHLAAGERLGEVITRSWNRLVGAWAGFRDAAEALPKDDPGTTLTREKWLLLLFQELAYGRLQTARAVELDGKSYPVSHGWGNVPIHLVGARVALDRRTPGVAGAAAHSPHGLLQELLNRSEERLWGFVSNGLALRVLRDNSSLTRQAYVEFDLEQMMEGEVYSDFVLLWLVCHESRVEAERPVACWLERWSQAAAEQGTRALEGLRQGVQEAIEALGRGFLAHPANAPVREALRSGELTTQDYYRELLRLVYRLLFLFVAEDRELLFDPIAGEEARGLYERFYSTRRLRRLAERRRGTRHADLWQALRLVMRKLGEEDGSAELALPALGSFLWSQEAVLHLAEAELANPDLLEAVRSLAFTEQNKVLRAVDYKNLGSEELGSVYESLLELHPDLNVDAATFALTTAAGHERKTTGSYYTPSSLVHCLLDSALDPVLDEAASQSDPERAILDLKVCDPATGSGHFLVAAAHRIAKRLAAVRTGDEEPAPEAVRTALRDVVGHCLYGVDVNPMAVELCKVSLWMEALEPGRPLSFLDAHIRCGNSLLGTTPELLAAGIPDDAFKPIEGDDRKVATELRKGNRREREGQLTLDDEVTALEFALAKDAAALETVPDDTIAAVHEKERRFRDLERSPEHESAKLLADAWCAAFVQRKVEGAPHITQGVLRRLARAPAVVAEELQREVELLADEYDFFHWHVEFPTVFGGPKGGFDCVLGNPPWERVKLQEKEFFAETHPEIANARNKAQRARLIERLATDDPSAYGAFQAALRRADGESHLLRDSGRYPLCGRGDVNTYSVFAETMRSLIAPTGHVGCVVPSGIATDDTTQLFFADLVGSRSLVSLFEFENEGFFVGAGHGHMLRFCLLTLIGSARSAQNIELMFRGQDISELADPERRFTLSPEDFALLNPTTRTCPIFRTRRDAELTKAIYRRVPVLVNESRLDKGNPWGVKFMTMFHMANDSHLFRTGEELEADGYGLDGNVFRNDGETYLPLYEAKMFFQFDHRHGDYRMVKGSERAHRLPDVPSERLVDPAYIPLSYYWVSEREVLLRLPDQWNRLWLIGWRNVTDARASARTVIASLLPWAGVNHSVPLLFSTAVPRLVACLYACMSSFVLDYVARQKLGGINLTFFVVNQLVVPRPETFEVAAPWSLNNELGNWVAQRVLELSYNAWDLEPFARDIGYGGSPFRWASDRRFLLRCELDAAFFRLYGLERNDVDYVMDTFSIVSRRDEQAHGEYRTKRVILEIYDELAEAIATGRPYQTRLDPPPADPRVAHQPRRAAQSEIA